jgi:hypothetical protein
MSLKTPLYDGQIELEFDERKHVYRVNGKTVPGVTGILGVINKPALVPWAVKMCGEYLAKSLKPGTTLDEVEIARLVNDMKRRYRDVTAEAADIGTHVHRWAEQHAKGENPPWPVNPQVRSGVEAYCAWLEAHHVEPVFVEKRIYSRLHDYAGTVDLVAKIDGRLCIADFKTSSALYDEMRLQLAAYQEALQNEFPHMNFAARYVLRFPKDGGQFEAHELQDFERDFGAFHAALTLSKTLNQIKYASKAA